MITPKNISESDKYRRLKAASILTEFKANLDKAEKKLEEDLAKIYEDAVREAKRLQQKTSKAKLERLKKEKK